jgi:alkanesulfonate monooxygenase SsuD/methylene tetrahydromethanopterin reductase-like flavin-dependent oxidoreductase (luciferase family)
MKLGVNILNFGPGGSPDSLRGWARFAEQAGFSIAMISDRGPLTPDVQALYPAPFYDPFVTLAWLAGQTEHIELGTTVALLPYRHPLLTARMVANIDQFSGGRFVFGVGVGWSEPEFAALGVPFGQRGAITDEYLAAITELWAGEVASMDGRFVSFREIGTGPAPPGSESLRVLGSSHGPFGKRSFDDPERTVMHLARKSDVRPMDRCCG